MILRVTPGSYCLSGPSLKVGGTVQTKEVQMEKLQGKWPSFLLLSFKLIWYCAVHQDNVVRQVLPSSWRRGPDKRSTNGKMAITSAFRHFSSYDTSGKPGDRVVRRILPSRLAAVQTKEVQIEKLQGMAVISTFRHLSSCDTSKRVSTITKSLMMQFSEDSIAFRFKPIILEFPEFSRWYTAVLSFRANWSFAELVPYEIFPRKFLKFVAQILEYFPAQNFNLVSALPDKRGGPAGNWQPAGIDQELCSPQSSYPGFNSRQSSFLSFDL